MNKLFYLNPALFLLIVFGCQNKGADTTNKTANYQSDTRIVTQSYPEYAQLFSVEYKKGYKLVSVKNPYDTTRVLKKYILVTDRKDSVITPTDGTIIEVPVKSMAIAFTTHIGYAKKLGILDKINGVSQRKYIKNSTVLDKIKQGKIKEFGPSHNINVEKLLNINPQILLVAPFKDNRYEKITDVGVNLAINASYMENTPLARAEWIKFIAYFFNKEEKANHVFDSIASNYSRLQNLASDAKNKPTIFSGKKIGQVWYVPGGNSYIAKLFKDAGADYLWKENKSSGSLPLDFETVYMKAKDSEFWAIKENFNGDYSYKQLASEYVHYNDFQAFERKKILFCNTAKKPYYEEGILEPDSLLADFIHLIHPQLLPDYTPKFYEKLK